MELLILVMVALAIVLTDWTSAERRRDEYRRDMERYAQVPDEREGD